MNITIGTKIKELRCNRKLTQEELGYALGVSFQAVSKWENNIALPDISLIPSIASFFAVSIDELFDYNTENTRREIENICLESVGYRESDPEKGRELIESALEKYPSDELLLNNLLYVIDYTNCPDDTISIASELIDHTSDSEIRYDALRFLAYAFKAKGDMKSAAAAIEQIPEIYFTKLTEQAFLLDGEEKYIAAEKQKWLSFEHLLQMQQKLSEYFEEKGEIAFAKKEVQRALTFLEAIGDENKSAAFDEYRAFFADRLKTLSE